MPKLFYPTWVKGHKPPGFAPETVGKDKFYDSAAWIKLRAVYLQDHPLCVDCQRRGVSKLAKVVHHILPRSTHPHLSLVYENLEGVCWADHNRKSPR